MPEFEEFTSKAVMDAHIAGEDINWCRAGEAGARLENQRLRIEALVAGSAETSRRADAAVSNMNQSVRDLQKIRKTLEAQCDRADVYKIVAERRIDMLLVIASQLASD